MIITKVTRSYSKSINAKNYGAPESWVKVEAVYEATCESGDNPMDVSKMLYEQCQKEVIGACNDIAVRIKESLKPKVVSGAGGMSGPGATATTPRTL